jgi:uncharacterized membrane protein YhiD involved in acid resistance
MSILAGLWAALETPPGLMPEPGEQFSLSDPIPDLMPQLDMLGAAAVALPLATLLGAALAFRPRRPHTPPRTPAVIQTQMLLAIVGALVMLVVGQSLARAFGIVGVASLIRYRAKVDDPKDAGVMLTTLGVGLAAGVGLYLLAVFSTLFVLGILWWAESMEPKATKRFLLKVTAADPAALKSQLEQILRRHRARFELRSSSADAITYDVQLPLERKTDAVSESILALDEPEKIAVEWDEKKGRP